MQIYSLDDSPAGDSEQRSLVFTKTGRGLRSTKGVACVDSLQPAWKEIPA
jgi:hypothetical protein